MRLGLMVVGTVLRVALRKLLLIWLRLLLVRTVVLQMQTALWLLPLRRRILLILMTILFDQVVVFVRLVKLSLAACCVLLLLQIV